MNSVSIYCLVVTFCEGAFIEQITPLSTSDMQLDFIYFTQELEWSAARAVCQSLGGDLAKTDSAELIEYLVSIAEDIYKTDIFKADYWVGLVGLNEGHDFWVTDCTNLTYTENYIHNFEAAKVCFKNKRDHTGDRRACTSKEAFMCQVQSSSVCRFASRLTSEVLSVGTNIDDCQSLCQDNSNCWATVEYVPDNCVTLAVPGLGVQNLTVRTKYCFNVTLNTTTVTPDLSNNTISPDTTCGPFSTTSTSNVSVVTSVSLPQCEPVNVTQYVTLTSTKHTTISTTDYSTLTSTESITIPTTEYSTLTSTESFTTTEYSMLTSTESFTTTEHSTVTTTTTDTSTTTETTTQDNPVTSTESITIPTTEYSTLTSTESITIPTTEYSTLTSTESITIPTTEYSTLTSTESITIPTTEYSTLTSTESITIPTTEYSTLTSTESITISTTEYSTLTSTESFTATENLSFTVHETTTMVTTDTMTETETTTSTESMYINLTLTVTSTVLSTYTQNITTEHAEEIAAEIAKNLTIDTKSTSSHIRRLTSANDPRQSAQFVGYVGVLFVVLPLAIMLLADLKKLFLDFRSHDHIYRKK